MAHVCGRMDGRTDGLAQHSLYHPVGRFFYLLSSPHIRFAWHDDDEDDDADDAVASVCPLVGHESKRPMMKKSSRQLLSPSAIPTDASPPPNRLTTKKKKKRRSIRTTGSRLLFYRRLFPTSLFSFSSLPKEFQDKQTNASRKQTESKNRFQ